MKKTPVPTYEAYGRGEIGELANSQQHSGPTAKRLRVIELRFNRPDGIPWNLLNQEDQEMAMAMVERDGPDWIIGAPPCRFFSVFQWNTNFVRMTSEGVRRLIAERFTHHGFMWKPYAGHISKHTFILHEHSLS